MHNKKNQKEHEKCKEDDLPIKNSSHKAFVERLRKQVASDPSTGLDIDLDDLFTDVDYDD